MSGAPDLSTAGAIGRRRRRRLRTRAPEGEKELRRIAVALCLGTHVAQPRLLVEALSVEHLQHADVALVVAQARQVDVVARRVLGARLRLQLLGAVVERLQ